MSNCTAAVECLAQATADYGSITRGDGVAIIERLGISVRVKELQTIEGRGAVVFISEFTASLSSSGPGMSVTCVGIGDNAQSAIAGAVAQWVVGVLPVVARWRGDDSCSLSTEQPTVLRGQFDVVSGPVVARGAESADSSPASHVVEFANYLLDALGKKRLAKRIHWLEAFAVRHSDGDIDATCRLNNHDWSVGRRILMDLAKTWPVPDSPMLTCRQFTMLLPKEGNPQELTTTSFWNRLTGSA